MDFQGATSAISSVPLDVLVIGIFFLIVSADSLRSGPTRATALALSLPITLYLFQIVPKTILVGSLTASFKGEIGQLVIFLVIEAILFVCFHQMFFAYDRYSSLLNAAIAGAAATAVLVVVWIQTPVLSSLWQFGPHMQFVFGNSYSFFWFILAYFALAYVGG
ncbi:MAG TPA: hypothetical protein VMH91_03520 [Candidatus Paceibacterota bacterium]|nr:hypothetical protein [Candidatus Paceibacterota bacterium]